MRSIVLVALVLVALGFQLPALAAKCVITEHRDLPRDGNGQIMQVPNFPPVTTPQAVTYTSSTQSTAFTDRTTYIGFICDAKAHFEVDANPTATADDPWVPADTWLFIEVPPGAEIAFYDGTT